MSLSITRFLLAGGLTHLIQAFTILVTTCMSLFLLSDKAGLHLQMACGHRVEGELLRFYLKRYSQWELLVVRSYLGALLAWVFVEATCVLCRLLFV